MRQLTLTAVPWLLWLYKADAIEIPNGVTGAPTVECGSRSVTLRFRTETPFAGRAYVKGRSGVPGCELQATAPGTPYSLRQVGVNAFAQAAQGGGPPAADDKLQVEFTVQLGTCDMRRVRQLQPNGMQQSFVVIISFHPLFLTKADVAYNVRCFYTNENNVLTQNLDVSMMTTDTLAEQTSSVGCVYALRQQSADGPEVRYARVGQPLYHVWECDIDPAAQAMLVRNCVINGGATRPFLAVDSYGCPTDPYVMPGLTYEPDGRRAYVETHAFKFADRPSLAFQCEITICDRAAGRTSRASADACDGVTPPTCRDFNGGAGNNGGTLPGNYVPPLSGNYMPPGGGRPGVGQPGGGRPGGGRPGGYTAEPNNNNNNAQTNNEYPNGNGNGSPGTNGGAQEYGPKPAGEVPNFRYPPPQSDTIRQARTESSTSEKLPYYRNTLLTLRPPRANFFIDHNPPQYDEPLLEYLIRDAMRDSTLDMESEDRNDIENWNDFYGRLAVPELNDTDADDLASALSSNTALMDELARSYEAAAAEVAAQDHAVLSAARERRARTDAVLANAPTVDVVSENDLVVIFDPQASTASLEGPVEDQLDGADGDLVRTLSQNDMFDEESRRAGGDKGWRHRNSSFTMPCNCGATLALVLALGVLSSLLAAALVAVIYYACYARKPTRKRGRKKLSSSIVNKL